MEVSGGNPHHPIPGPGRFLLMDAAGPLIQTGLWDNGHWLRWIGSTEEAGRSLFIGAREIFDSENLTPADLDGFLFCEGPGSMLGIRIAAMAIRGWQALAKSPQPVFTYSSHAILSKILLHRPIPPPFHIISDARRNRWNVTSTSSDGTFQPTQQLTADGVVTLKGPLFRMEEPFRNQPPRPVAETISYNFEKHAGRFLEDGLLRISQTAAPLTSAPPQYQKWHGERHR